MGTLRILVAEDDPDLLDHVAHVLEQLGADVTRAATGGELVQHLSSDDPFDLIVTDISMPWMSGLQAMHSTRYAGLETPVIVMTALRDASIPAQVRALGKHALLLHKPFTMLDLQRAVARLLPEIDEPAGVQA
jgi:CheY-like chemotaxis protein